MTEPPPPIPGPVRTLILVVSAGVLLSALAVGGLAVAAPLLKADAKPSWALFGFEVVTAAAAVIGILLGRGRFRDGPGMALACISGSVLVAAVLGWYGAGRQLLDQPLLPLLALRAGAAVILGAAGAWCVLSRNARAWKPAIIGAAMLVPVVAVAGAAVHPSGRLALDSAIKANQGMVVLGAVIAFVVVGVLLSGGVHLLIKAFELGRPGAGGPGAV